MCGVRKVLRQSACIQSKGRARGGLDFNENLGLCMSMDVTAIVTLTGNDNQRLMPDIARDKKLCLSLWPLPAD